MGEMRHTPERLPVTFPARLAGLMKFRKVPATLRPWPTHFVPVELTDAQRLALFELVALAVNDGTEVIRIELQNLKTEAGQGLGSWQVMVQKTAE